MKRGRKKKRDDLESGVLKGSPQNAHLKKGGRPNVHHCRRKKEETSAPPKEKRGPRREKGTAVSLCCERTSSGGGEGGFPLKKHQKNTHPSSEGKKGKKGKEGTSYPSLVTGRKIGKGAARKKKERKKKKGCRALEGG